MSEDDRYMIAISRIQSGGRKMGDAFGLRAAHLRHMAAHLRSLASLEPLESLRRHLRRLAAQHDEAPATLQIAIHPAADGSGQAMGSGPDSCLAGNRSG